MKKFLLIILLSPVLFFLSCKPIQSVSIGDVENTKLINLSREGIEFEFDMKIKNPNSVGITIYPSVFEVIVNDINVGEIKLTKKVRIKAKSDNTSTFHIKSNFSKLGAGNIVKVMSIIASKSANLFLKGEVKAGKWFYKKKFPVELKKNISLSK
ncbi:MAG: LEA type 2 family protein [Bacteroidota bacterium]